MSTRRFNVGGSGGSGVAAASAVTFDSSGLIIVSGTDVQAALESVDAYLDSLVVGTPSPWYGNGSDGDVVISSDMSITRDMFYDNLTVNAATTLTTTSDRIFVRGTLTLNGTIANNGGDSASNVGGVATVAGSMGSSGSGATGTSANGGSGTAVNTSFGGDGGDGGDGSNGTGGTPTFNAPTTIQSQTFSLNSLIQALIGAQVTSGGLHVNRAGGPGGGGAGDGVNFGGGGGGGGGAVMVVARQLAGTGSIEAIGGAGFTPTTGDCGGGGGGGGGFIVFVTSETTHPYTITAAGGSGGAGVGTGTAGDAGSAGNIYEHLGVI